MEPKNRYEEFYQRDERTIGASATYRKRIPSRSDIHSHHGVYEELETLRNLVDDFDGERTGGSKGRGTVDGSLMSTVFAIVLIMILSISVYAFTNLYRAVMRRFYKDE